MRLSRPQLAAHLQRLGMRLLSAHLQHVANRRVYVHALQPKLELIAGDPCDIQQILDQPRFQLDVAPDHLQDRPIAARDVGAMQQR